MTPERWQQMKEVLATALDLAPAERSAYLDKRCAGDGSLRDDVERMLLDEQRLSPQFLESTSVAEAAASVLREEKNPWIGRQVGSYRIVEQIGAGGMGEVYRAFRADDQFRKEVALKVVRAGQESGAVINRFRNERQILASLDHPGVARLLDGGTTEEGTPYFVMELIQGRPITEYCDHHRLSVAERLELFCGVCEAVQYAHQHLIIHRDIKPGNILVTEDGTPKLLDFGISKMLDFDSVSNSSDATLTAFRVLTPRYASPEQIMGESMTTASDVYSLGMVLYELLTGRSPYRVATGTPREIADAACQTEPIRPSVAVYGLEADGNVPLGSVNDEQLAYLRAVFPEKLHKRLIGDLDNILLMALRKEPVRRYASVEKLEEDIRRHLRNIPVIARNDTVWYRASKFVIRHKAGVVASVMVAVAIVTGVAVALREAHIARQQAEVARIQRARADRRFNDVRKLANSLMFEVHDSIRDLPGATPARKLLVNRALEYLDSLSQEASGDAALQRELAAAYDRVGDLLGYNGAANLGDYSGALQSYNKALAIRESSATANPEDVRIQGDLLNDYFHLSFVLNDAGDSTGALRHLERGIPLGQHIASTHPEPVYRDWLAGLFWQKGRIQYQISRYGDALESYRQAASIREPIAADVGANPLFRTHLAGDYIGLGKSLSATGELNQAVVVSRKGMQILEQLGQSNPTNATLQEYLGEAYSSYAGLLQKRKDYDQALAYYRKAQDIFTKLIKTDPTDSLARDNTAMVDINTASALLEKGSVGSAIPLIRRAIGTFERIDHKNRQEIEAQAGSYATLARAHVSLADKNASVDGKTVHLREAQSWYRKGLSLWQKELGRGSVNFFDGDYNEESIARQLANCDAALAKLNAP